MPVIINEFEAVADTPPGSAASAAAPSDPAKRIEPAKLRPPLRHLAARARRLWAH